MLKRKCHDVSDNEAQQSNVDAERSESTGADLGASFLELSAPLATNL